MNEVRNSNKFDPNDIADNEAFKNSFNQVYESVDTIDLSRIESAGYNNPIGIDLPNLASLLEKLIERGGTLRDITVTLISPEGFAYEVINQYKMDYEGYFNLRFIIWGVWSSSGLKRVYFHYPGQYGIYMNQVLVDIYGAGEEVPPGRSRSYSIANFSWVKINRDLWPKFYRKDVKIKFKIGL